MTQSNSGINEGASLRMTQDDLREKMETPKEVKFMVRAGTLQVLHGLKLVRNTSITDTVQAALETYFQKRNLLPASDSVGPKN